MGVRVGLGLGKIPRFGERLYDTFVITPFFRIDRLSIGEYESYTCVEACSKSKRLPA
jgi:hypothetical protein